MVATMSAVTREIMPLSGMKVVDLTRFLSGPFCTMLLADLGAEIIKIESLPDGDPIRRAGATKNGLSTYFATFNRDKKSLTLDLRSTEGRAIFEKLVAGADVVVDNFRPGVMDRLGLGRARLRALKPGLICASITGFGETGPYRDRPAFDFIAQALSGFMSMNGQADGPPLRSGLPVSDLVAGLYCALGIVAAIAQRCRSGEGDVVTTNLASSLVSFLSYAASQYFATGEVLPRSGNDHPISAPYGLFQTGNGAIAIAPAGDEFFVRLMRVLGLESEAGRPEFATSQTRVQNRALVDALVTDKLMAHDSAYWIARLNAAGVPCGPVYAVDQVFADPQIIDQQMSLDFEDPVHGSVRVLGRPIRFADHPGRKPRFVPDLGADKVEILAGLGLTPAEIADLQARGIV
jgi:crotonobetainyl-CoA:carnitine CoA-transferase CaiB-like acyl-CoA transferase